MATNVSYASGDTNLESLVLTILPDFGVTGDGISNSNLLTAYLKEVGSYQNIEGGLEFWHGITKAENSNGKWQGKNDDMTANSQDPLARMRWDPKVFTSAVVLNALDRARNRGRAAIKQYLTELNQQATDSVENDFNSALWASSPGSNDPDSIPSIISATPTTGTIGGLSRSGNTYLQNGAYTTAITDIGAEAGIAKITELKAKYAIKKSMADLMITTETLWGSLAGFLVTQRRYRNDEKMAKIGFEVIDLGGTKVGYENTNVLGGANTITSGYLYGINSKYMFVKHLLDPDAGMGSNGWSKTAERVGRTLNKAFYYNWFGNLTTSCPRAHFVCTSVA